VSEPRWEDADERLYELARVDYSDRDPGDETEGYDSLVDRLMACDGYDRAEAELVATARMEART
jgi:hypothetical protein